MNIVTILMLMASVMYSLEGIRELSAKFSFGENEYIIEVVVQDDIAYLPIIFESVNLVELDNNGVTSSHRDTGMAKWPDGFQKFTKGQVYRMRIGANQTMRPTEINLWAGIRVTGGKLMSVDAKNALVVDGGIIYEMIRARP